MVSHSGHSSSHVGVSAWAPRSTNNDRIFHANRRKLNTCALHTCTHATYTCTCKHRIRFPIEYFIQTEFIQITQGHLHSLLHTLLSNSLPLWSHVACLPSNLLYNSPEINLVVLVPRESQTEEERQTGKWINSTWLPQFEFACVGTPRAAGFRVCAHSVYCRSSRIFPIASTPFLAFVVSCLTRTAAVPTG